MVLDVLEEVEVGDATAGAAVGLLVPAPGAIAKAPAAGGGSTKPPLALPELKKPADVCLPAPTGRRPVATWVGSGAAVVLGSASVLLLAPLLFPAAGEEHLFVMEKVLFSTVVSAVGGFLGWAVAGRLEGARG